MKKLLSLSMSDNEMNQWAQEQQETYQRVINRAGSFLSQDQVQSLTSFCEKWLNQQEMGMKMGMKLMGSQ